jgi:hypothetical protein
MAKCKELEVYLRKLQKKNGKGAAAINSCMLHSKETAYMLLQVLW